MRTRIIAAIALGSVLAAVPAVGLLGNEVVAQQVPRTPQVPKPSPVPSVSAELPTVIMPVPPEPPHPPQGVPPPPGPPPIGRRDATPPPPQQLAPQAPGRPLAEETRGGIIRIAGRDVQLPPDAYVEGIVMAGLCPPNTQCPETPYYNIVRGRSRINITQRTGRVVSERTVTGEERTFDELKRRLP